MSLEQLRSERRLGERRRPIRRGAAALVGFVLLWACGGETATGSQRDSRPALEIVSGAGGTDTVKATIAEPFVVELRNAWKPVP